MRRPRRYKHNRPQLYVQSLCGKYLQIVIVSGRDPADPPAALRPPITQKPPPGPGGGGGGSE